MKNAVAMLLIIITLFSIVPTARAAEPWPYPESQIIPYQKFYTASRDEYRMAYWSYPIADSTRLNYWTSTGVYYEITSNNPPAGHYYLTCNGTYILELFRNGVKVGETPQLITTKIQQPACQSYSNADSLKNDLGVSATDNGDGTMTLDWDDTAGADHYDIYKDGEKIGQTTDSSYDIDSTGSYTVVAVDPNGNIKGESDYNAPNPFPSGGGDDGGSGGSDGSCDACEWLTDMLACPAWDEYMGELTNAIKDALPPPPDWPSIADIFVGKFADYFGEVPVPPSVPQIENNVTPPLPPIDTSVPGANISPSVPSDFNNGALDTDITKGEEISVEDGSEAFEIYEPDKYIKSDDTGVMVYPNDTRNNSDGIKEPDKFDSPYKEPVPQMPSEDEEIEHSDVPVPSQTDSTTPIPNGTDLVIPIPADGRRD